MYLCIEFFGDSLFKFNEMDYIWDAFMKSLTHIYLYPLLFLGLFMTECNRERKPLSWTIDGTAPLINGSLSLKDILPDSILTTNSNNSINLSFESNIYRLNFDSLVKIPDTTVVTDYNIPFSAGITFSPGQTFISQPENISLNINDVELTKITVKNGRVDYKLSSNIPAEIIYEYKISNAIDEAGNPFSEEVTVPAAGSSKSFVTGSFSLDRYSLDLTGTNNNLYNTLSTFVTMKLSDNHNEDLLLNNNDSVKIENTLSNLSVKYAEGYFGNQSITTSEPSKIAQMDNIINGTIDIEQLTVGLNIINGIGADAKFSIQNLTSKSSSASIPLNHQLIGQQNFINRASNQWGTISSTKFTTTFNTSNSNIENWIENLPDSILYAFNFELNPLGNVSGHSDFIDATSPFEINMTVDMPLSFIANNLTLLDTITVTTENIDQILSGKLKLTIDNGFPLAAKVSLKNIENGTELFSQNTITAAAIDNNGLVRESSKSNHTINFTEDEIELLKMNNDFELKITFDSPISSNPIAIYDDYKIGFNVVTNFTYQTLIE